MSSAQGEESSKEVRTAFIDIIKQLEVIDVQILDAMFNGYVKSVGRSNINTKSPRSISFSKTNIMSVLQISEYIYENSVDNLMRVRCVCSEVKVFEEMNIGGESATIDKGYDSLNLTSLGVGFVVACIENHIQK